MPEIRPSSGEFGRTEGLDFLPDGLPILGIAGDQQASLIGQGCVEAGPGEVYLWHRRVPAGPHGRPDRAVARGLITTLAATLGGRPPQYALEGSVFVAGAAVQWFRDGLKAIGASYEISPLALAPTRTMDVIFVPALTGLGAPYWQPAARGTIFGLTRATSIADLARATLEGVAFQVADLIEAMDDDLGAPLTDIRVDGGMARSDPFLQFQADLLGLPIHRSPQTESTALGAARPRRPGFGLVARPVPRSSSSSNQGGRRSSPHAMTRGESRRSPDGATRSTR